MIFTYDIIKISRKFLYREKYIWHYLKKKINIELKKNTLYILLNILYKFNKIKLKYNNNVNYNN